MSSTTIKGRLKPTRKREYDRIIYGFDIETFGTENEFYCGSVYSDDTEIPTRKVFYSKGELIYFLTSLRPRKNICIVATNLSFDFFGSFFGSELNSYFKLCWRGSDLLSASTYVNKDGSWSSSTKGGKYKIEFIDTMNYAKMSVEKMGNIIGIKKLKTPACLGRLPEDEDEKEELITYNLRDSEISYKFMRFLDRSFSDLGATPKITIASTAMSLFRNVYLKDTYYVHDIPILDFIMKGYYGGRTEVFSRGYIKDYLYYDVNSLYPSVMLEKMPDPNSIRKRRSGTIDHILRYEGFSEVTINCPDIEYPLLPVRHEGKLIFPTGTFKGVYSHLELRKAIAEGYNILDIRYQIWFKDTCRPFKEFVEDLYTKRKQYKETGSSMELVVKLCLNSLYGKFAQSFRKREQVIHKDTVTIKDLNKNFERIGDYFRIVSDCEKPAVFCFPEWSAYITSYARIKMYDLIKLSKPIYCDTDSLITKRRMPTSPELGDLKLEYHIKEGYIIKPKLYMFIHEKGEYVKAKGIMGKDLKTGERIISYDLLKKMMINDEDVLFHYHKFSKFRESIRKDITPNTMLDVSKELSLEDNKRQWFDTFNAMVLQHSRPLRLYEETVQDQHDTYEHEDRTHQERASEYAETYNK